jgi:hypothetical protein
VQVDGLTASVFETNGTTADGTPARIVAAILHRDGTAWFFKMAGDDALVAKHKSAFLEFLKSFQFIAGEPLSAPPVAPLARNGRPQWDVPPGWKEAAAGQFLVAKFVILGEDNARAEVNVSSAAGDGGGLAANVNRWRRQLGLSVLSNEELSRAVTTLDTVSGAAALVEMQGKDPRSDAPASVVGIIAPVGGSTWFYKLTGDAKLVEAQRDAFINFAKGARY